jgi:hypothetical protein
MPFSGLGLNGKQVRCVFTDKAMPALPPQR